MPRRIRSRLVLLICIVALMALSVLTWRAGRQEKLNQSLMNAIEADGYLSDNTAQVLHLLDEGADPNSIFEDPPLPFRQEIVKKALTLVGRKPPSRYTHPSALIEATRSVVPNPTIVKVLLQKGASVNVDDDDDTTPLSAAVANDSPESLLIVKMLLDRGANVRANDASYPIIARAAGFGRVDIVRLLIAKGADVNAGGADTVALIDALLEDHMDTMKVLIDCGADVNRTDGNGLTALAWLKQITLSAQRKKQMKAMLKRAGAKE